MPKMTTTISIELQEDERALLAPKAPGPTIGGDGRAQREQAKDKGGNTGWAN